jgi:hypothetical protein
MGEALGDLLCNGCEDEPIAEARGLEVFCASCAAQWTVCDGCGDALRLSDAITPVHAEGGMYHAACCPDGSD